MYDQLEKAAAGSPVISPSAITVSANGGITFTAAGGQSPYTFSVISGRGSVTIDGVYTASFTTGSDTVRVTDRNDNTNDAVVTVTPVQGPLTIIPPAITLSTNDTHFFATVGGTTPYTYARTGGTGTINPVTGEFTAPGSPDTTTIEVTDDVLATDTSTVTIVEGLVIIPQTVSVPANNNVAFSASGGIPGYTYVMESGAGSVTVGGFYTAPGGTGTDEVKVTDNVGSSRIATITVTAPQPLNIIPSSFIILVNDNFNFSASGGTPLYAYSVVGSGFINSSTGDYSTPAALGTDTVRVTDATLNTADATVEVAPAAPSNLVADGTLLGPQEIVLTWTDNVTGEDGFSIERKVSGGVYAEINTVGPNVETYPDGPGLSPGVPYSYRVRAYKLPGPVYSGYSNDDFDIPNP